MQTDEEREVLALTVAGYIFKQGKQKRGDIILNMHLFILLYCKVEPENRGKKDILS